MPRVMVYFPFWLRSGGAVRALIFLSHKSTEFFMKSLSLALLAFVGVSSATSSGAQEADPCLNAEAQYAACDAPIPAAREAYRRETKLCEAPPFSASEPDHNCMWEAGDRRALAQDVRDSCRDRLARLQC